MADPNDVQIPAPVSNGTTDQPGGSQIAPPVPEGFSDIPVSSAPAVPAGFSDTPQQEQGLWNKITHGGEASTPGQAEQFEQYKKDKWKNIINHVESGNLHGAAGEFLNLFQNPYGGGTAGEVGVGALKSAGQTVNTVSDAISHVLPKVVRPEDVQTLKGIETVKGAGEQTGAGLETLAEFMMGDEALKGLEGLTRTEKLAKLMPHMKMLENSPKLMKAAKALYNISKMSGLSAGVSAAHPEEGQTRGEAAQAGAIGGAVFGTGAEALSAGASTIPAVKNAIESVLRPTTETVGSTEVPVRNPSKLGNIVQKTAPDTMAQFAREQTGPAVAQGIGQVAKEAAGTEGIVSPDQHDRLGIRGVADEVAGRSKATFQKLDEVSGNMLSEAQTMADDASGDFTSQGRKEYRQAMDLQDAIFDNYKNHSELQGMDLDQAKADWRKQIALRDISKKLTGATESSETGNLDYQFKQGKQLSEAVDSLVKNDKDVLQRAGFSDTHIDQLQKFGRIIRQQAETPKFATWMGGVARTLSGALGAHTGGLSGLLTGAAAESASEHAGGWLADRMLGKVLTTPAALKTMTEGLESGANPGTVTEQLKKDIAQSDPTWAAKTGEILSNLWHDESGQLKIPGTGEKPRSTGYSQLADKRYPATTVGTAEGAKADTAFFQQAKEELGEDASFSDVAKRAQEMKTQANLSGPGAEGAGSVEAINRANAEKAQGLKRVVVDTRSGQERPLLGVDAVDYQAKPYESVEFRGGDRDGEIIDQGKAVRPYERKYSGEERRSTERKTMNAAELDAAMKNRKLITTPFDYTEGAMQTIAHDQNMPKHPGETASDNTALSSANHYQRFRGKPDVSPAEPTTNPNGPAIADAYEKMPHDPANPEVKKSYDALKSEVDQQWDHAQKAGIKFEPWDKEGQPYANSQEMRDDVAKNKHLYFFQGGDLPTDHPMAEVDPKTGLTFNDKFRAVHDLYGHAAHGYQFGPAGEDAAYRAHSQMFSPEAKPALTTETRGQNSWVNYGPHMRDAEGNILAKGDKGYLSPSMRPFAEQKAGILPESAQITPENVLDHIRSGKDYAVVTAENPENSRISDADNADRNAKLVSDLRKRGYNPIEVQGNNKDVEGKIEHSFFVPDIKPEEAAQIGKKYGQSSVLTTEGLHDLKTNKVTPSDNASIMLGDKARSQPYYSSVAGQDFSLPLDFSKENEPTTSGRVGQRKPTGKAEAGHDPSLNLGMDVINKAGADKPEYLQKLADKVAQYPTMKYAPEGADESFDPEAMATTDPHKILNNFVKQAADNIEWLHNQVPPDIREMSKNWYDSANKMTKDQAEKYGISHPQAAAVTAVLSPQNPWDNNISLANRVLDVWKNRQNFKWSPEMSKKAASLLGQSKNIDDALELIHGKTFAQLKDADPETEAAMKGLWTRVYDEAHNPRTFERWAPDGTTRGIARNAGGAPANSSWFSILPISKAISVLEDGSMDNIHEQLGDDHKVRNFYNNIIDPNSKMGDTTVDTHAVRVAHLSPFSLDAQEVKDNFGGSSHKNAKFGLKGTYPLYAEAYKQAADRLGILPRQLQSITWEGIRSLFKDKSPELQGAVRDIWKDHQDGNITIDDARKRIIEAAGGFKPTDWQSDIGANETAEQPANAAGVSRTGVSQEEPQTQSRGRSRSAGAVSTSGNRQSQIENVYKAVTGGK